MAGNKLSTMDETGAITGAERIEVLQGGQNKAMTLSNAPHKVPVLNSSGYLPVSLLDPYLQTAINTHGSRLDDLEAIDSDVRLDALEAAQAGSMIGFTTKALMDADLAHDAGVLARVTNDDVDPANNGVYIKLGATGAGSWQKSDDEVSLLATEVAQVAADLEVTESSIDRLMFTRQQAGASARVFVGASIYPLLTDSQNRVLLGFDAVALELFGKGVVTGAVAEGIVKNTLHDREAAQYTGSTVYPLMTDAKRRVLLGYDAANNRIVGPGLDGGSGAAAPQYVELAAAARPVIKAVNHLLFYGQSLAVGAKGTPVISVAQPYSNITFHGGPRGWDGASQDLGSFKPLVEDAVNPAPDAGSSRGETPCSGAANFASTLAAIEDGIDPSDHVILASTAGHGGWKVSQLKKGTSWYSTWFLGMVNAAYTLNADYAVHATGWIQGENDSDGGTTYASYRSDLEQLQVDAEADIQSITGQTAPVYFLTYQTAADVASNPDPALAQLDLAQRNDKFYLVAPIYHMPRDSDGTHLTATGYKWLGAYFGRAYKRLVIDGVEPAWLNPKSATVRGSQVRVRFDVPVAPMVLDTTFLAATNDYGFAVEDDIGVKTITSVSIDGSDVVIELDSAPTGSCEVRYALDYLGAGLNITNGKSGNLRDSAPESITIAGATLPIYNLAPSFRLTAITLGE